MGEEGVGEEEEGERERVTRPAQAMKVMVAIGKGSHEKDVFPGARSVPGPCCAAAPYEVNMLPSLCSPR